MSVSMLNNDLTINNKKREKLEKDIEQFLMDKRNKITVCPPLPEITLPLPAKITIKAEIKNRRRKKVDNRKRIRIMGIEYNEKKRAMIDGFKFGKLTPVHVHEKRANDRQYIWACRCDCGGEIDVRTSLLTRGIVQSCNSCAEKAAVCIGLLSAGDAHE